MNSRFVMFVLVVSAITTACTSTPQSMPMYDTLFVGETVIAGPDQAPQKQWAILVDDGIVRDVGPADELHRKYQGQVERFMTFPRATTLPGLTDAHGHLYGLGLALDTVNLVNTTSYSEVLSRVRQRAASSSHGEWILGRGWDQNDWSVKEFPTASELDAAVPNHPVWLRRIDGHAGLANSAAMRAAGVTAETKDPEGGRIVRDASGQPTGVFVDEAMELIDSKVPPPSQETRKRRVLAAAQQIAANGLTEMHDAGADGSTITAIQELIDEKRFPIRVYVMLGDNAPLLEKWFRSGPLTSYGGRLTVRAVKLYADGALGSRGAALLAPYSDDPGNSGLMIAKPEHIADVSRRALAAGFQVNTHAIGDRGVRNVIDAYETAGVKPEHRFRIEHLQVVAPGDFPRLAQGGIIASMQPTHATSDSPWAEARVGPERIQGAYAWRTVLNSGGRLALGSDFPVEEVSPMLGIDAAVNRGGWRLEEKLSLAEAIRGFTSDAAFAAFEEGSRGTIEPGKLADFTVVDGDLYSMQRFQDVRVRFTIVGGEVAFSSK